MEFFKNFIVLITSTLTYVAGLGAICCLYLTVAQQDVWYLIPVLIGGFFVLAVLFVAKRSPRLQAALEFPFGILHL